MSMAANDASLDPARCVVRDTAARRGRTRSLSPGATSAKHLHYGRIILGAGEAPLAFSTGEHETGLIGLAGTAAVAVEGQTFELGRYDALYVPRDCAVEVRPGSAGCDLAEISAPVAKRYPVQHVSFAEVQKDPGLHFKAGGPSAERTLNVLLGKNVEAGRLMAGVTFSAPGNWTSWPPHEHAALAEEAYLYIDMPAPGFGLQLVYTDQASPELAVVVREGDLVLMPRGYHPNVAAPGGPINFLWMMAANRETDDRLFGVVNVHPDFRQGGSGLEAGRAAK
jgi:5-deoxy-glucuronate isomerase